MAGARYDATQPTLTTAHQSTLQLSSRGSLFVTPGVEGFPVTGSGNFTVTQATGTNLHIVCDSGCSSSTAPADESAFTYGSTSQTPIGGVYNTAITALTSGQMGAVALTPSRSFHVAPFDSGGTDMTDTTAHAVRNLNVDATGAVIPTATLGNGTNTNAQLVTIASDSTGQVKSTNFPTTVTLNAGAADASTLRVVNDPLWGGATAKGVSTAITTTTSTQVIAAVASNFLYITSCQVTQSSTTVGTAINLQDGSAGTTLATIPAPAAANSVGVSGSAISFPTPLKVPTLGNGLFAAAVTTGSNFVVSCQGFSSTVSR